MNYIIIQKDIYKQLTEDEFLIYCFARFEMKVLEDYTFSSSILNYKLNATTTRARKRLNIATKGLIEKGLLQSPIDDVYIINKTENIGYYFVLYDIEFEALKSNSNLLRYFCFLVTCLDNKTHQFTMANSFIQNGFNALYPEKKTNISNKTVILNNDTLTKLNLIEVIKQGENRSNIIKRVHIAEDYKNRTNEVKAKDTSIIEKEANSKVTQSVIKENKSTIDEKEVNKRYAEAIGIAESEINIRKDQYEIIDKVGLDNFIIIAKDCMPKYHYIFENQNTTPQQKSGIFIGMLIKNNELEKGLEDIKSREEERQRCNLSEAEIENMLRYTDNNNIQSPKPQLTDLSWALDEFNY
ncbi:hypothetical protein bsdE14_35910 [Clostridium omnivorum]|uniref:Uncharacterized protein n=1 Tax=Clostridium omnivorum TaxID=1604902 RepID=A0ABQ5NAQ8_9CLOT|nr:hypothetical protein bsdE14_35910 [Clostridium sp. E14]